MIQKKHIKKITTFLLLIVTVLTLVACSKKESVPYGSLSDDVDYITLGDISISEKEIYEKLGRQSSQTSPELITKKLFAGYADKEIGRASCRERGETREGAGLIGKKRETTLS